MSDEGYLVYGTRLGNQELNHLIGDARKKALGEVGAPRLPFPMICYAAHGYLQHLRYFPGSLLVPVQGVVVQPEAQRHLSLGKV